jgi:NAD(P)-dependent dehydrogenase (short-subunit alcohol dehydrogenase family)
MRRAANGVTREGGGGTTEDAHAHTIAYPDLAGKVAVARGGRASGVGADCTKEADIARVHQVVHEQFGSVDNLAAFAGGNGRQGTAPARPISRRLRSSGSARLAHSLPRVRQGGTGGPLP